MTFVRSELAFEPGLFANRSRRASKQRWSDGNLVRFRDGVPSAMGGWVALAVGNLSAMQGVPRAMIAWRPNNQVGRYAAVGTDAGAYLYDGDVIANITPTGFVPGEGSTVLGRGYGSDRYGVGTYGTERESTGNIIDASTWTFDMFGEKLLSCYSRDGIIYEFTVGSDVRLVPIVGAPSARAICVSDERHVFAFGVDGNPGRVSWSDRENPTVWEPLATNRAGGYDLQVRSPFQCGARVRGRVLGWTKTEVFAFEPLNSSLGYSRDRVSTEAGAIGPHAVAVVTDNSGEAAYWMGANNFFSYDGLVRALPCDLHDYVFDDINLLQGAKAHAALNTAFDEVWFFYCSKGSDEVDRAVVLNFANLTWTKATIDRSCWIDAGVFPNPLAFSPGRVLYSHEDGDTAAEEPLPSFIQSHPITVGIGERLADVDQFWPDFQTGSAACDLTFTCRQSPGGDPVTFGPYEISIPQEFVPLTFSAREFQVTIAGKAGAWELGLPQISMAGGSLR